MGTETIRCTTIRASSGHPPGSEIRRSKVRIRRKVPIWNYAFLLPVEPGGLLRRRMKIQKSFLILNFLKVNLRFNSISLVPIRIFTAEPHLPAGRQGDRRGSIIFPLPLRDRQRKALQAFMRLSAEGLGGYGETASHACVPKRCTSACRHDSFTRENLLSATSAALR